MKLRSDEQAIAAAERALAAAHLTLDLDAIDRLLHPAYVNLQPDGTVESKPALLASLRSGQRHWDHAAVDQLEVTFYGTSAVVIGHWRARGRNGDLAFDYAARFLSLWVKEDGHWRNVAYQATEIAPPPISG